MCNDGCTLLLRALIMYRMRRLEKIQLRVGKETEARRALDSYVHNIFH